MVESTFQSVSHNLSPHILIFPFSQAVCTDPQAATSTAFLQAIGDGKFEVVKPFEGVPSLGGKMPNNKGGSGGGGFRPSSGEEDQNNQLSLTVRDYMSK